MSAILRACPGIGDEHFILYHLPQERGWAYIHQLGASNGHFYEWPETVAADEAELFTRLAQRRRAH